jgi:cation transport regulator ChaB
MATTTSTGTTGSTGVTTPTDPLVGKQTGTESSLSNWAGPYVTEMLGRGQALASQPYQAYTGPLTAGQSGLQTQAFQGLAGLTIPTATQMDYTPQSFTQTGTAQQYMNPYLMAALQPQIDEARRQADISRVEQAGRLTRAGAYGGGRQAIMESELNRNLLQNLSGITGAGYKQAFDAAQQQFNTEQARQMGAAQQAQQFGLAALQKQADVGGVQRAIEQQGVEADIGQFREERDFPYKQVQYMQSLLQGLPLAAQTYSYAQPSALSEMLSGAGGIRDLYNIIFGGQASTPTTGT